MPCKNSNHVHDWPDEGELRIFNCERECGYCTGRRFEQCSHLRAHVNQDHVLKDKPKVNVLPGISGSPSRYTYEVIVEGKSPVTPTRTKGQRSRIKNEPTSTPSTSMSSDEELKTPSPLRQHRLRFELPPLTPSTSMTTEEEIETPSPTRRFSIPPTVPRVEHSTTNVVSQVPRVLFPRTVPDHGFVAGPIALTVAKWIDRPASFQSTLGEALRQHVYFERRGAFVYIVKYYWDLFVHLTKQAQFEHHDMLILLCCTFKEKDRILAYLEFINQDGALDEWVVPIKEFVDAYMASENTVMSGMMPIGCMPFIMPSWDLYFWASYTPIENLTVDKLMDRIAFARLRLHEDLWAEARHTFDAAVAQYEHADRLSPAGVQLLDDLYRDFGTHVQPLLGLMMEPFKLGKLYTADDLEEWLAMFRAARGRKHVVDEMEIDPDSDDDQEAGEVETATQVDTEVEIDGYDLYTRDTDGIKMYLQGMLERPVKVEGVDTMSCSVEGYGEPSNPWIGFASDYLQ